MKRSTSATTLACALMLLPGCARYVGDVRPYAPMQPIQPVVAAQAPATAGSIYRAGPGLKRHLLHPRNHIRSVSGVVHLGFQRRRGEVHVVGARRPDHNQRVRTEVPGHEVGRRSERPLERIVIFAPGQRVGSGASAQGVVPPSAVEDQLHDARRKPRGVEPVVPCVP